jgi:Domain of unknown function (DUF6438)
MRVVSFIGFFLLTVVSDAQTRIPTEDFSIRLVRGACLGSCPEYAVTIFGNGSVRYEGHWYVRAKGIHEHTIPVSSVQKLIRKIRDEDFFNWTENENVCVDSPTVDITAAFKGERKHVLEGCSAPGKILRLANEIDRISGSRRWVGNVHDP